MRSKYRTFGKTAFHFVRAKLVLGVCETQKLGRNEGVVFFKDGAFSLADKLDGNDLVLGDTRILRRLRAEKLRDQLGHANQNDSTRGSNPSETSFCQPLYLHRPACAPEYWG